MREERQARIVSTKPEVRAIPEGSTCWRPLLASHHVTANGSGEWTVSPVQPCTGSTGWAGSGNHKAPFLLSPRAVFSPKDHTARGEQTVRFIQDDVEVTGTRWAYDHAAKKVSLEGDVRVTFRARITDILR